MYWLYFICCWSAVVGSLLHRGDDGNNQSSVVRRLTQTHLSHWRSVKPSHRSHYLSGGEKKLSVSLAMVCTESCVLFTVRFDGRSLMVCLLAGLSLLVCASFTEDSYGVVQSSLPGIITIFLDTLEVSQLWHGTYALFMQIIIQHRCTR